MKPIAITIPKAVEASGFSRSTLYKLFGEKKLTPRKAGRRTLILVQELEALLTTLPIGGRSVEGEHVNSKGEDGDHAPAS